MPVGVRNPPLFFSHASVNVGIPVVLQRDAGSVAWRGKPDGQGASVSEDVPRSPSPHDSLSGYGDVGGVPNVATAGE